MTDARLIQCGDDAIRIVLKDRTLRYGLAEYLQSASGWTEVVIGRESVTVQYDPYGIDPDQAERLIRDALASDIGSVQSDRSAIILPVLTTRQDAPDLGSAAAANGLTPDSLLERISNSELTVDMLGFSPGFAYVSGVDPQLRSARLHHPRQRTPAGSIGFINGYLGIYALEGPGGWPIIGRTTLPLFDKDAETPVLLSPGMKICMETASDDD